MVTISPSWALNSQKSAELVFAFNDPVTPAPSLIDHSRGASSFWTQLPARLLTSSPVSPVMGFTAPSGEPITAPRVMLPAAIVPGTKGCGSTHPSMSNWAFSAASMV